MPNIVARHESWEVLVEHVANTKSVTLSPIQLKERSMQKDVVWIPLNDTVLGHYQQYIIWRDDNQKLKRFEDSSDFHKNLE